MAGAEADGLPFKKKSLHAQERDTEANRKRRQEFVQALGDIAPEKLIFLDEAAFPRKGRAAMPGYGWGAHRRGHAPGPLEILTILGAMSTRGIVAAMTIEEATDSDIFLAYLDQVLCPKLRPGDVVVMDNLSAHKVKGVRERIEAAEAKLLYLPPYSPDLNPIERPGPSSSNCCARPKHGPKKRSTKPSRNCSHFSLPRMHWLGSDSHLLLYGNRRHALVIPSSLAISLFDLPFTRSVVLTMAKRSGLRPLRNLHI